MAVPRPAPRTRPAPATPDAAVLACGLATLDVVQTVVHVPGPDEKVVATDVRVSSGGPAANAAVTCAALGVPVRLLTRIGQGTLAELVSADLRQHGVDVVDLAPAGSAPPVATVLVTGGTGQRAVVPVNATVATGAPAPTSTSTMAATAVPNGPGVTDAQVRRALTGARVLLVDGHHLDLALPVARAARARGLLVVLDGGSWKPGLDDLLALVDVAVLSANFRGPAGAGAGPRWVARSHGAASIELHVDGTVETIDVPQVAAVDTLGAGDVLHGALVAWFARRDATGLDADQVRAGLRFAAQVASASCTGRGARAWVDTAGAEKLRAALASG